MKIAIVHDWLVTYAGAERVLEQMISCYPDADLFTTVNFLPEDNRSFLSGKHTTTSFIQKLPAARSHYRSYLPLMPLAVEQFDMTGYDLVISSSYAVAKGILTGPDQLHICMCYSPMRYAWDLQHEYLRETGLDRGLKGWLAKYLLHRLRIWDYRTAGGVDEFISISGFIARRIQKVYRRESTIIYPPVDIHLFSPGGDRDNYYITASRMVPYKRIDLIVDAFTAMPDKQLIVIGDGPEMKKIREKSGSNIRILGYQPHDVLKNYLQRANAFVFAAQEDFGIAPLEAQACGTPVIAFGKGGVMETIRGESHKSPTGVFFEDQTVESLVNAVKRFEEMRHNITAENCRNNAERFSPECFRKEFRSFVDVAWKKHRSGIEKTSV